MFSREIGRPKGAKSKDIFGKVEQDAGQVVQDVRALAACFGLSLVQVCSAARAILLTLAKMDGIPPFCPLSCFALVGLLAYMALFRIFRAFLAGFRVVVWVCIALVLCVACGAFVRVNG